MDRVRKPNISESYTPSSESYSKPFVGLASIDINDGRNRKFRIAKLASTFKPEALAIGETL
jgi:hypothetical protein